MNIGNLFKIAVKALSNNKFRGFLTMLGIIIGVAAVITMLAIGQGSKRSIQAQISEMGSNMIMIHPGGERRGGVRLSPEEPFTGPGIHRPQSTVPTGTIWRYGVTGSRTGISSPSRISVRQPRSVWWASL